MIKMLTENTTKDKGQHQCQKPSYTSTYQVDVTSEAAVCLGHHQPAMEQPCPVRG